MVTSNFKSLHKKENLTFVYIEYIFFKVYKNI